jgi:hypothetical protein
VTADCTVATSVQASSAPAVGNVSTTIAANASATAIDLVITGPAASGVVLGTAPTHGTVSISGESASYTPDAGYSGPDSFSYFASNSLGSSSEGIVSITVTPPTVGLSVSTVAAGGMITVTGSDFAPNEPITVILHSTPVTLATFTADSTGAFSRTVTIPTGTAGGSHTLLVTGATSGTVSTPVTVTTLSITALPTTGGITSAQIEFDASIAVLFGIVGAFVVYRERRSRRLG